MSSMIRSLFISAMSGLVLLAAAPAALAGNPCQGDVETFCSEVPPGGGEIVRCLNRHRDEITPECRDRMREDAKRILQVSADCLDDVDRYCSDVNPGEGRVAACLARNERRLEPACRKHVQEARANLRKRLAGPCDGDIEAHCKGVKPGRGRIEACLQEHRAELSKGCVQKLENDAKRREERASD